jgi:tRNA (guanine-N7-)-methyltransferase
MMNVSKHVWLNFAMQNETNSENLQHVRSFVKRKGHFSGSRRAAFDTLWPKFGIEYETSHHLNFTEIFHRTAPVVLEIGFGMGITTAEIAQANPKNDYLGVEVYSAGVASLMKLIGDHEIPNIRAIQHDVFEVVRDMLPDASLDGIHLFFPDPWPKLRHQKRRLLQPAFIQMLHPKLKPGGYLHCATDWEHYAEHMLHVLSEAKNFKNTSELESGFCTRPPETVRPLTKFENRGIKLGHGVWDLIFSAI